MRVRWQKESQFQVTTDKGMTFNVDADSSVAPCPTELLLSALGACSATDVVFGLQQEGANLVSLENNISYVLTDNSPRLYKSANLHFVVKGELVSDEQIGRIAQQAIEKHCHVCLMLQPQINITYSINIL